MVCSGGSSRLMHERAGAAALLQDASGADLNMDMRLWDGLRSMAAIFTGPDGPPGLTTGTEEMALVLARCGVLTLLVRWATENCTLPNSQVGLGLSAS